MQEISIELQNQKIKNVEIKLRDITLTIRLMIDSYLKDIEKNTEIQIKVKQKELLKEYVNNNNIVEQKESARFFHRLFYKANKDKIISEWEKETGQNWPIYKEDVFLDGAKVRNAGQYYDAHHIIESSFNGPNEWWNMHPASYPNQHQGGIHAPNSIACDLFGKMKKGNEFYTLPDKLQNHFFSKNYEKPKMINHSKKYKSHIDCRTLARDFQFYKQ